MSLVGCCAGEALAEAPDTGQPWDDYTAEYLSEMGQIALEASSTPTQVRIAAWAILIPCLLSRLHHHTAPPACAISAV